MLVVILPDEEVGKAWLLKALLLRLNIQDWGNNGMSSCLEPFGSK